MKKSYISRGVTYAFAGTLAVLVFQIGMVSKKVGTARESAIQNWASSSPARENFFRLYKIECEHTIRHKDDPSRQKPVGPITFKQCAEVVAQKSGPITGLSIEEAAGLGHAIEVAINTALEDSQLPAPLRWL